MRAMVMNGVNRRLELAELPVPRPGPGETLLRVAACGVCRTDLHLVDGDVEIARFPRVLGHQIVGIDETTGQRVGVPWLAWTCGSCSYCVAGRENLCPDARFTGKDVDGGFAEYTIVDRRFCFPIPNELSDVQAAPLLCAGLIGFRSLSFCGDARRLGLYGFGAAAHIIAQVAVWQDREVCAFTRPGDSAAQEFARSLGASWAGDSDQSPPEMLDAAIIFAPVGELVPLALQAVAPGGTVVCGGIHMSDIPSFPYRQLWEERVIRSVANLTRADATRFLSLAPQANVQTEVQRYELEAVNDAFDDLRAGRFNGAAVVVP